MEAVENGFLEDHSPVDIVNNVEVDPEELSIPDVPRCLRFRSVTQNLTSFSDASRIQDYRCGAHVLIWAPWEGSSIFGVFRAAVMMHMRFDGSFGFPGGLTDPGEDIIQGLTRELTEEIGWETNYHKITWNDYHSTQVMKDKKLILHFFLVKLSMEHYVELEKKCLCAAEYGIEVFGTVRVPLYTMENQYGGFPAFLNNKFVGAAKQQLLLALYHTQILSEKEIEETLCRSQNLKLAPSRF